MNAEDRLIQTADCILISPNKPKGFFLDKPNGAMFTELGVGMSFEASATVEKGVLSATFDLRLPFQDNKEVADQSWHRGKDVFRSLLQFLRAKGYPIDVIRGCWTKESGLTKNLDDFNVALKKFAKDPNRMAKAVEETWTAKQARENGFTGTAVFHPWRCKVDDADPTIYKEVVVDFLK